jgi:hypothetical protein
MSRISNKPVTPGAAASPVREPVFWGGAPVTPSAAWRQLRGFPFIVRAIDSRYTRRFAKEKYT